MGKRLVVSYALSIIFVIAILFAVDVPKVLSQISGFGLAEFAVGAALVFFTYVLRAVIWRQLLSPFASVPLKLSYDITVAGFFLNNFLPLRAGEIARAFLLDKSHRIGKLKIFSTIIVERLVEGLSLVVVFAVAVLFMPSAPQELANMVAIAAALFGAAFIAFLYSSKTRPFLQKALAKSDFLRQKALPFLDDLFTGAAAIKKGVKENLVIWGASLALWGINFILYYFVAQSLGIKAGVFELAAILAVSTLSTIIPSAPGYIGTFEAGFIVAFAAFGLGTQDAVAMAVIIHLLFFAATTLLGLFSIRGIGVSLSGLVKSSRQKGQSK